MRKLRSLSNEKTEEEEKSNISLKKDIQLLRSLDNPPHNIINLLLSLCIVFNIEPNIQNAKKLITTIEFYKHLECFDWRIISR